MEKLPIALVGDSQTCWDYVEETMPWLPEMRVVDIIESGVVQTVLNELAKSRAQAVILCMPIQEADKLVEQILKIRRSVFCVQAISLSSMQLARVKYLLEKNQLYLQLGVRHALAQELVEIQREIEKGDIGDINIIRITNRANHRDVTENHWLKATVINDFAMARYVNQAEVKSVFATSNDIVAKLDRSLDASVVTLQMEGGTLCIIDSANEPDDAAVQRIEVFGSSGYRQWEQRLNTSRPWEDSECLVQQLRAFSQQCLSHGHQPYFENDSLSSVATGIAAQRSYTEKRIVSLCEIMSGGF